VANRFSSSHTAPRKPSASVHERVTPRKILVANPATELLQVPPWPPKWSQANEHPCPQVLSAEPRQTGPSDSFPRALYRTTAPLFG